MQEILRFRAKMRLKQRVDSIQYPWLELIPTQEQFEDALPALSNSLQLSFILGLISLISVFLGIFVISILLVIEKKVDQPEESVGELELEEESRWF